MSDADKIVIGLRELLLFEERTGQRLFDRELKLILSASDFIKQIQAENERLTSANDDLKGAILGAADNLKKTVMAYS